ncbi:MAG TPA: hypothetical protein VM781_00225, partial [Candidatus Bathyarchaeia archaeon]|nr:hypothetical protein [Candidatus Bathyarchaeia archaeon]
RLIFYRRVSRRHFVAGRNSRSRSCRSTKRQQSVSVFFSGTLRTKMKTGIIEGRMVEVFSILSIERRAATPTIRHH